MKNLRRNFERFCYSHRNKGIPNLMLIIGIGMIVMFLIRYTGADPSGRLYYYITFNRSAIFRGEVWRLITHIFVPDSGGSLLLLAISVYFYYFIGKTMETNWGTLKFNLFYLTGLIITDAAALILGIDATSHYLNLSLLLAFATMYPENRVLLMMIIPLKMKYLAWFYFALTLYEVSMPPFTYYNLFPIFALLNYFLFFGADILQVLPDFMRPEKRASSGFGNFKREEKPNPNWAKNYQKKTVKPLYRHKCTVCGRTDTENPDLEFRYCSKCNGYYCYCMDHINDHAHIP